MEKKSKARAGHSMLHETPSQLILLEEYRALHTDYLNLRTEGVNRVNFFITAMSVFLGGALVIASSNSKMPLLYFELIVLAAAIILGTIGLEIYNFLIYREIASDRHIRGLARIRNYFVKLDPQIRDYFVHKTHDAPSTTLKHGHSGLRRTLQIIEGFFIGLIFTVSSTFFSFSQVMNVAFGVAVAVLAILFLEMNARRRLRQAFSSAEAEIRFSNNDLAK